MQMFLMFVFFSNVKQLQMQVVVSECFMEVFHGGYDCCFYSSIPSKKPFLGVPE